MTLEPQLELIFENHVPSKKNHGRSIARGGQVFHVPSEAHQTWHKAELLSLIEGLPGCRIIAAQVSPLVAVSLDPNYWDETALNDLVKGMRQHSAIYPGPYAIEYDFYPGSLADWDLSNAEESINDLLVDARLIEDDSWQHLRERRGRIAGFANGAERCVVRLYCLPRRPVDYALAALKEKGAVRRIALREKRTQKAVEAELRELLECGLGRTRPKPGSD